MVFNLPFSSPFQGHNRCKSTSLSQINSSIPAKGQDFSAHLCSSEPGLCFYTGRSACSSTATLTSQGTTLTGTGDLKVLDHVDHFMFNVTPAHSHPSLSGPPKPSQPLSITTTSPSHYSHPRPWATATRLASPGSPNSPYLDPKKPEEPWFSESLLGAPRLSSAVSEFSCVAEPHYRNCAESTFWHCLQETLKAKLGT